MGGFCSLYDSPLQPVLIRADGRRKCLKQVCGFGWGGRHEHCSIPRAGPKAALCYLLSCLERSESGGTKAEAGLIISTVSVIYRALRRGYWLQCL